MMNRLFCLLFVFISVISNAQTAQMEVIIPMQYVELAGFSEGLSWAYNGDKWGVVNTQNDIVIPFKYELPGGDCKNGRILIPGESAYYDSHGNMIFTYNGKDATNFSEGLAVIIIDDNNYSVVDEAGREVFKCQNQFPGDGFHEGMLSFHDFNSGLYGYVNVKGEVAIPAQFSDAKPFSEGLGAVADQDGKYGFVNMTGALAIPCSYNMVSSFCEGYAWCEINGTGNYIDKYGSIKIKDRIQSKFEGGLAIVKPSKSDPSSYHQFGAIIINKDGDAIFGTDDYEQTHKFGKEYFLLTSGDSWAITDNAGNYITKSISTSEAIFQYVNESNIVIIQEPKTGKIGAVQLVDSSKRKGRLPGESYAHYVERLHNMGVGLK